MIWFALILGIVFGMAILSAFVGFVFALAKILAWLIAIVALAGAIWVGVKAWQHYQP